MLTYCEAINKISLKTLEGYHAIYLKSPYTAEQLVSSSSNKSDIGHKFDPKMQINQPKLYKYPLPIIKKENRQSLTAQKENNQTLIAQKENHQILTISTNS